MTERLTKLVAAEQMISGIRTLTEVFRTEMSDPAKRDDRAAASQPVNDATDELIRYLRENFPGDETVAASITSDKSRSAVVPLNHSEESGWTAEEHKLYWDVKSFFKPAGDTPYSPSFDAETLVNERDAVVIIAAMKYLLAGIKAPVNSQVSKEFGPFAENYVGIVI